MPTIAEAMTPEAFAQLDALCVKRLEPIDFGSLRNEAKLIEIIRFRLDKRLPLSWRQRVELYKVCYRLRTAIADMPFIARVLIAKAEADPIADEERSNQGRTHIRAWASGSPFSHLVQLDTRSATIKGGGGGGSL